MKKRIFVELMGGLGNQLFQYSAGRAVYERWKVVAPLELMVMDERDNIHNTYKHDYLRFMKHAERCKEPDLTTGVDVYKEPISFSPFDPSDVLPPVVLSGYFQYLPAIEDILPIVRQDIVDDLKPERTIMRERYRVEDERAVFIHVRRGDYLRLPDFHYIQSIDYYKKAYSDLSDTISSPQVFVLSDDLQWCREQDWGFSPVYIDEDEIMSLALMSMCSAGAIIANSTFSWWGAILSGSPRVYYPSRWINCTIHSLFPSQWIRISS